MHCGGHSFSQIWQATQRNVPIGLVGSLLFCTVFYILVAAGAVVTKDVGGSFGIKVHVYADEMATVWVVRGGDRDRLVQTFLDDGVVGVAYPQLPDGRTLDRSKALRLLQPDPAIGHEVRDAHRHRVAQELLPLAGARHGARDGRGQVAVADELDPGARLAHLLLRGHHIREPHLRCRSAHHHRLHHSDCHADVGAALGGTNARRWAR